MVPIGKVMGDVMKKISLLLVLALILTVLPVNFVTVSAATGDSPSYLLEDFENGFNDLGGKSMYSTNFTTMQYNGKGPASDKCLSVATSLYKESVPAKNYGPVFNFALRNGTRDTYYKTESEVQK